MKIRDTLGLSFRMFKTRPMRTMLTIAGVGVGIATVLFLVSFGYGLQQSILDRIATADTLLTLDVHPGSSNVSITNDSIDVFQTIEGVVSLARQQEHATLATFDGLVSGLPCSAVDPDFFTLTGLSPESGTLFTDEENVAVLTSVAAQLFDVEPDILVGKELVLSFKNPSFSTGSVATLSGAYRVVGIVRNDMESRVYVSLRSSTIPTRNSYDIVKIKTRNHALMGNIREIIMNHGFLVSSISDTIDQVNKVFRAIQIALSLFGLVALVVSAIGMFNTMTITLLERTNEIGIMRAIGVTSREIQYIFLVESMVMGFLGGAFGVLTGLLAGEAADLAIGTLAARFNGPQMNVFQAPTWFILLILGFSGAIGVLTGIYPSLRASRLNPLDALRYK